MSVAQAGFVAWLWAAAAAPVATVPIFVIMLLALGVALRAAPRRTSTGGRASGADGLIEVILGVYAGWAAAAVWINTATVLDRPSTSTLTGLLLGAVATAVLLVTVVARSVAARSAAGAASAWALCGVASSTSSAGADGLFALASAGLAAVVGASVIAAAISLRPASPAEPAH